MDDEHLIVGRAGGRFDAHENDVKAIYCSKVNPNLFYTGCSDGLCKMWDNRMLNNPILLAISSRNNNYPIMHIDGDSYDRYIVTTSGGVKFNIWDVRRFSENISFDMQQQQQEINISDEIGRFDRGYLLYVKFILCQ
ncbi:hypothetical protein LOAG_14184 [Loa loa]|uniref:Uncharacterized protein n=1 Tax=Loa loa TaxID=7209 RepID=A0A1S0TIN5_LOALO|nr:hypothetical protein LOAG_14184 [Loa loa]EFO14340.2 hypothetical protein LOAG_14184 [Loa loa]